MPRRHDDVLALAAARLVEPLAPADEERLESHLATCSSCRAWAAGYEADRVALRSLREMPAPPRDLWARTAASLDHEQSRRAGRGWLSAQERRPARVAFATALSVLLVVTLVGSGLVPGLPFFQGPRAPQVTPIPVAPQSIAYVSRQNGQASVYVGTVDQVCPESVSSGCLPLDSDVHKAASFPSGFVPQQLSVSPDGSTAAVVGTSASGGVLYAIELPERVAPAPTQTPPASSSPTLAAASPSERATPTRPPAQTASAPPPSATPTGTSGEQPGSTPSPSGPVTPGATESAPSGSPSAAPPTALAVPRAIIENITVVGEAPTYSADGAMLAFSAMPADGSAGPDIYLWRVGSAAAVPLTDDHDSIFASWAGGMLVGSRVRVVEGAAGSATPVSFLLDPQTGKTRELAHQGWRPVVDPTGRFVIFWDGTLTQAGRSWQEGVGGLYLARWELFDPSAAAPSPAPTATPRPTRSPKATPTTSETAHPSVAASPSLAPSEAAVPTAAPTAGLEQLVADRAYATDPILSWEAHWSPDGQWFGIWIGDRRPEQASGGPETGRLTVAAVDPASGRVDRTRVELDGVAAIRGFAMGDHRIAWATVPGLDGTSEVRLLVWTDLGRGLIRTHPGGGTALPAF